MMEYVRRIVASAQEGGRPAHVVIPTSPTVDLPPCLPRLDGSFFQRIACPAGRTYFVREPVGRPLPDIAKHVECAIRALPSRVGGDRGRPVGARLPDIQRTVIPFVAPWVTRLAR